MFCSGSGCENIGKIGVPEAIINKTSRLTDDEYDKIQQHTVIGSEILDLVAEFPELVTPDGDGWLIRHVDNIVAFIEANPNAVRKDKAEKVQALKEGFRHQWANKVRQMLIPTFATNTKGAWVLRFDDILADALEQGPLQNKDFDLPEDALQRLNELTPDSVPVEVSILLYKYYIVNKADDQEYVVLSNQNFNAYFGTTSFSQKWTAALAKTLIEKKVLGGVSKYKIRGALPQYEK